MKAAALVYLASDGSIGAIGATSVEGLLAQAKAARVSGKIGKQAVVEGVVMANWRMAAPYKFTAEKPSTKAKA